MPSVNKGGKILVSGANGYIGMWVVRTLLERGYSVRGTVRTEEKGKFMVEYFKSLGYEKFEPVVVNDMTKEEAFDEVVKCVDGIMHIASPFQLNIKEPEEMIQPAVQGILCMLKNAMKNGSQVQRIVITASCTSIMPMLLPVPADFKPAVYNEQNWNLDAVKKVEEMGNKCPPHAMYVASKTLAEKAAWKFYEEHKSQIKWDIAFIHPSMVFGPSIHPMKSPSCLNTSMKIWYEKVFAEPPKPKEVLSDSYSYVDVRDCALGHVLAMENEAAGGERIITSAGGYNWQEWVDAANSLSPPPPLSHKIQQGYPEINQVEGDRVYKVLYDKSKQARILGINYRAKFETCKDIIEDFSRRGW